MKKCIIAAFLLSGIFTFAQNKESDSTKTKDIAEVTLIAKKPTVENKIDRTVFNVANSSILAGNTTWDVLRMTPLVSIDNNDAIKAEDQNVTVYVNDRKTVFTGKELKEYLKTIPAENLMKIEVITTPSSRYETSGAVINIVLKKNETEGVKGSATFTNNHSTKNSQYTNLNINYHKKNFTQTLSGSYGDWVNVMKYKNENFLYADESLTEISTESTDRYRTPSISTTSEFELDQKNNIGLILEYSQSKRTNSSDAYGENYLQNNLQGFYTLNQNLEGTNRNLGTNVFYKYYDKEKNKIIDLNAGINYDSVSDTNDRLRDDDDITTPPGNRIIANNENREYYFKVDYSQPIGKSGGQLEFGGKTNFKNNVVPYQYFDLTNHQWVNNLDRTNTFRYTDNLNSLYANYSTTLFKKLETRIGLRYEYIGYKILQEVGNIHKKKSYGTLLPDLLLNYKFNDNYSLSANYKHNIWRPWFSEFNPFLLPGDNGIYSRGNMELLPNPSDRFTMKLSLYKKYFVSATYWFTNQDYWGSFFVEDDKTISMPVNFEGKVERYSLNANTNQTFFKNKLSINLNVGLDYTDNSDFNMKNDLDMKNYVTNFNANSNISYTNLFNKNININAWVGVFTQNNGNTLGNATNVFHTISATKIFPGLEMEASVRLNNIFLKPSFDGTTYSPVGTFRNSMKWDWHGVSFTLVKRFGNNKVKENSKTNVEKDGGGSK